MKQILLINDVVGHSHVGMVAMLPILTYQGHSVYNLPTALVSNTLDYGNFNVMETTEYMRGTLPVWQKLGFRFDAVCTGLMFSEEQARLVADYCTRLHGEGTTVFVDPIMGDGGRLYNGITQRQVELMREMVGVADLTFPNYTEACYLAGIPFKPEGMTWPEACGLLDSIVGLGARSVVVTSARVDGKTCVIGVMTHSSVSKADSWLHKVADHSSPNLGEQPKIQPASAHSSPKLGREMPVAFRAEHCAQQRAGGVCNYFLLPYHELPLAFHGTGDIFSAVLIGHLMNGESLKASTQTAMTVVSRLIDRNRDQQDKCLGIPIEQCLDLL